jgi:hypothetical protein
MPGITGMGTTFELPNFVGDLFSISPEDTPLLSAIGGLTGGREASDVEFSWQFSDLRDAADDRQRLEGDDAPDPQERVRQSASNVVEIHQEAISVSYTRRSVNAYGTNLRGSSPVADEYRWQIDQKLKEIARDVNLAFITGVYAKPSDNSSPRTTRGLLEAIVTNVKDLNGASPSTDDIVDLLQAGYTHGGMTDGATRTLLVGPAMKRHLSKIFITTPGLAPLSRNVGGVDLQVIQTDFGPCTIMTERSVPIGTIIALSLDKLAPRFLLVPGKGHFFVEPLAKTGARDESQIYGEIGLEYGNEAAHAKIVDATTDYDSIGVGSGSGSGS